MKVVLFGATGMVGAGACSSASPTREWNRCSPLLVPRPGAGIPSFASWSTKTSSTTTTLQASSPRATPASFAYLVHRHE